MEWRKAWGGSVGLIMSLSGSRVGGFGGGFAGVKSGIGGKGSRVD